MTQKETFLITRPTLASKLIGAGIIGEVVAHPFEKDRKAWVFRATQEAVCLARGYYQSIGAPLPNSLKPENIGDGIYENDNANRQGSGEGNDTNEEAMDSGRCPVQKSCTADL